MLTHNQRSYVLMTAAHDEERFIERTIASVLSQTLLPQVWVIVSDNSTDRPTRLSFAILNGTLL